MPRCFHVTTFCPSAHHWTGKNMDSSGLRHLAPLDQEESVAEVFAAKLYSQHTFAPHQGATLPALIQALHIAHTSYSTCRPRYAHTASNTGILCCLQCREQLLIFFLFFFFSRSERQRQSRDSQRGRLSEQPKLHGSTTKRQ